MADQYALIDQNHYPAQIIHTGTANDSETVRRTGQASGAADTHITGGTVVTSMGDLTGGTIDLISEIAGTVTVNDISGASGTTVVEQVTGTVTTGSLADVAQIHDAGTVAALPDLPGGTVDLLTNLGGGTVQINPDTVETISTYGTLGTTGAAVRGTLVAAVGSGTNIYVTGLSVVVDSGTVDCAMAFGTQAGPDGADVLARGKFNPGGGIARDYTIPVEKSNGTLTYYMGGAGTAYFTAQYWTD